MSDFNALVTLEETPPKGPDLVLRPDRNLYTGIKGFSNSFGLPTSLETDLLTVASAVYACDLAFKRGERENITRQVSLTIPVINYQAFERLKSQLEYILYFLSHDSWTVTFSRADGVPERSLTWTTVSGKTLLFSGGLDSFAGAVDLLDRYGGTAVQLVSHVTANQVTRSSQDQIQSYLNLKYKATLNRVVVRSGGRNLKGFSFPSDKEREETQRTRSFMFLAIAALAARRSGHSEIVMIAENGQMAIHLPLSAARIGAFSTHTAHPEFVVRVGEYFTQLLGYSIKVENPYLYRTKAEVVKRLVQSHRKAVGLSVSCWRGSRTGKSFHHCGECIPCLVRRIALEFHGLSLPEYERDLLIEDIASLDASDEGKRNLSELSEFIHSFQLKPDAQLLFEYIDLVNQHFDLTQAIAMYRRFAGEAQTVLSEYPNVAAILGTAKSKRGGNRSLGKRPKKK